MSRPSRVVMGAVALVAVAVAAAGCGGERVDVKQDSAAIHAVAEAYMRALARRDAARACSFWSRAGQRVLVRAIRKGHRVATGTGCVEAVRVALAHSDLDVRAMELTADFVEFAPISFTGGEARIEIDPPLPPLRTIDGQWRFVRLAEVRPRPSLRPRLRGLLE